MWGAVWRPMGRVLVLIMGLTLPLSAWPQASPSPSPPPAPPTTGRPATVPTSRPTQGPAREDAGAGGQPRGGTGGGDHAGSARRPTSPAVALRRGLEAFEYGRYLDAVVALRPLVEEEQLEGADRVQALRTYAVALFLLGRRGGSEAAFLLLLRDAPNTRLDPALVPPEAIGFFEAVRARHRADIRRAAAAKQPSPWLNLIPPLGQFQNQHRGKGWLLLSLEVAFLAFDLTTYFIARSMPREDGTVPSESRFNTVKTLNIVAFSLLGATVVYGILDGFYYYGARRDAARTAVVPLPVEGGVALGVAGAL